MLYWDTDVCKEEVYMQDELDDLVKSTKPAGGGGTDVECVPDYMAEHGIKPECVVVLTDGYLGGSWGQWSVPVLWCIQGNKSANADVGVTVHIEEN
jgi:predicted metal-dependent peptidase